MCRSSLTVDPKVVLDQDSSDQSRLASHPIIHQPCDGQGLILLHTHELVQSEVSQASDQVEGCDTNKSEDNNTGVRDNVYSPCYDNGHVNTSCTAVGLDPGSHSDRMVDSK